MQAAAAANTDPSSKCYMVFTAHAPPTRRFKISAEKYEELKTQVKKFMTLKDKLFKHESSPASDSTETMTTLSRNILSENAALVKNATKYEQVIRKSIDDGNAAEISKMISLQKATAVSMKHYTYNRIETVIPGDLSICERTQKDTTRYIGFLSWYTQTCEQNENLNRRIQTQQKVLQSIIRDNDPRK